MDEDAFLKEHAAWVYNLSLRLLGNVTDAEDLTQDILIKAFKGLPQFRGESSSTTWLYRIAINTWKNRVRSEKRRGLWSFLSLELFRGEDQEREPAFAATDPSPGQGIERQQKQEAVQTGLLALDDENRSIILLRDFQQRSYREISQILGVPEGTVKSRLSRARENLKRTLKTQVGGETS